MKLTIVDHPVSQERLTQLRDVNTEPAAFRGALQQLSLFLLYEATRDLPAEASEVQTPLARAAGTHIAQPPLLVPVLRAALGMLDAALTLLPTANVGFLGIRRNDETLRNEHYVNTMPTDLAGQASLLLDPMLATGGSMTDAADAIRRQGGGPITAVCVLAAPEGVERLRERGTVQHLVTGCIDAGLDERSFIVPGLGDAGDRQFGAH